MLNGQVFQTEFIHFLKSISKQMNINIAGDIDICVSKQSRQNLDIHALAIAVCSKRRPKDMFSLVQAHPASRHACFAWSLKDSFGLNQNACFADSTESAFSFSDIPSILHPVLARLDSAWQRNYTASRGYMPQMTAWEGT